MSIQRTDSPAFIRLVARWGCILVTVFTLWPVLAASAEKRVIGWIEKVSLEEGLVIDAKVDTGAEYSSINITNHELFKIQGQPWIRFILAEPEGGNVTIERRIVRYAKVKRKGYRAQVRPVVELSFCLGQISKSVQVNLVDRSQFEYRMLVGRSFLAGDFIVDPAIKFTTQPTCSKKANQ